MGGSWTILLRIVLALDSATVRLIALLIRLEICNPVRRLGCYTGSPHATTRLVVPENSESRIRLFRLQKNFLFGRSLIPTPIKRSNQLNTIHDIHHRAGSLSSIKFRRTVIVCVPVKPELLVHQEAPVLPEHKEEMLVSNEKMDYELKTPSYYPDLRLSLVAGLLRQ